MTVQSTRAGIVGLAVGAAQILKMYSDHSKGRDACATVRGSVWPYRDWLASRRVKIREERTQSILDKPVLNGEVLQWGCCDDWLYLRLRPSADSAPAGKPMPNRQHGFLSEYGVVRNIMVREMRDQRARRNMMGRHGWREGKASAAREPNRTRGSQYAVDMQ